MRIGNLPNLASIIPPQPAAQPAGTAASAGPAPVAAPDQPSFAETVKGALESVNQTQANADQMTQKLATGDVQDIHQVMLALNQASNSFGLTVQVRNKAMEAYQEIMRMQV